MTSKSLNSESRNSKMREKNSSHVVKHELNPRVHRRLMLRGIVDQYLELLYHEITPERVKEKFIA